MPVHRQKKDTTPTPSSSTQEQTVPPLPDQQTFQQYLRELARGAIRVVLEAVMREELRLRRGDMDFLDCARHAPAANDRVATPMGFRHCDDVDDDRAALRSAASGKTLPAAGRESA